MSSLLEQMGEAHATYARAHHDLLVLIAQARATEAWRADGAANLAGWVSSGLQVTYPTAHELVRQSKTLTELPALRDAYATGELSADQVKSVATIAEGSDDTAELWLELLPQWPIDQLHREARKTIARRLERDNSQRLSVTLATNERGYGLGGFLHFDDGALLITALERQIPADAPWKDQERNYADALVSIARIALSNDTDRERATLVVSVDETVLTTGEGTAMLATGDPIPATTAQRLACDARYETTCAHGHVNVEGPTRTIPRKLRRQLLRRDVTCCFPGCDRTKWLRGHHIIFWPKGRTILANLILACDVHHKLVHEHRWTLRGDAGQQIIWVRPDGIEIGPLGRPRTSNETGPDDQPRRVTETGPMTRSRDGDEERKRPRPRAPNLDDTS